MSACGVCRYARAGHAQHPRRLPDRRRCRRAQRTVEQASHSSPWDNAHPLPTKLDYAVFAKGQASLRPPGLQLVRACSEWTDYTTANFGNILIGLFAHVGGVLSFAHMDQQAGGRGGPPPSSGRTCSRSQKLIGYQPERLPRLASISSSLAASPDRKRHLRGRRRVFHESRALLRCASSSEDATIDAGADPPTVTVTAANRTSVRTFSSSGLAGQGSHPERHAVLVEDLLGDRLRRHLDARGRLTNSDGTDRHYGDGRQQLAPQPSLRHGVVGALPRARSRSPYGRGTSGNVEAGTVTRPAKGYTDSLSNPVAVTCTSPAAATPPSTGRARPDQGERACVANVSSTATVAREDYGSTPSRVPGVARPHAHEQRDPASRRTPASCIIPDGGGLPTLALKAGCLGDGDRREDHHLQRHRHRPVYVTVAIGARIYLKPG